MNGDLDALDRELESFAALGCDACEITAVGLDVVVSGRLIPSRVNALRAILGRYEFAYSQHAPIAINLMDLAHLDLHVSAALAAITLAGETGTPVVVLHPGRVHPKDWATSSTELLARERDVLSTVADRAAQLGVRIAYENISPNPRVLAGAEWSYALDPAQLAGQLEALSHGAVMACLDVSHAQQGAGLMGFNINTACAALTPHIGHIHFSDCTGLPATISTQHPGEREWLGIGDMHAPPGFGTIDFPALAAAIGVQPNTRIVIEVKRNFHAHARSTSLEAARTFGASIARPSDKTR